MESSGAPRHGGWAGGVSAGHGSRRVVHSIAAATGDTLPAIVPPRDTLDRMLKNYGEEGPEGLGVSRENALTAMKRYRAWLKHEEMIERLFRQADANDSRTLERGGEIKVFLTLIVNEFPELRGVTVEDSDVDFILERCDGFSNGVKNEVIDMEEAGPAVATWIQVVRAKVRPSRRLRATPHRCTSSH